MVRAPPIPGLEGLVPSPPARRLTRAALQVLAADLDLLNPPAEYEKNKHKLKRLVQSPNSFFMDVKCQVSRRRRAAAAARAAAGRCSCAVALLSAAR